MFALIDIAVFAGTSRDIYAAIGRQDYAIVKSHILNETILITRDPTKIPRHLRDYVAYGIDELPRLDNLSKDELRRVHVVKKAFQGTIVS